MQGGDVGSTPDPVHTEAIRLSPFALHHLHLTSFASLQQFNLVLGPSSSVRPTADDLVQQQIGQ